jgi:hypothetical protein
VPASPVVVEFSLPCGKKNVREPGLVASAALPIIPNLSPADAIVVLRTVRTVRFDVAAIVSPQSTDTCSNQRQIAELPDLRSPSCQIFVIFGPAGGN